MKEIICIIGGCFLILLAKFILIGLAVSAGVFLFLKLLELAGFIL